MQISDIKKIVPHAKESSLQAFFPFLVELMPKYEINTPLRQAAFIAQIAHESGSFKYTREIASGKAYEGRKDLGNVTPGDGVKFKGRGLIQVTGRRNYRQCSLALFGDDRLDKNPDLLSTPRYAVESACWFWKSRGLNKLADNEDFDRITRSINGGFNGKAERDAFYTRAKQILTPTESL